MNEAYVPPTPESASYSQTSPPPPHPQSYQQPPPQYAAQANPSAYQYNAIPSPQHPQLYRHPSDPYQQPYPQGWSQQQYPPQSYPDPRYAYDMPPRRMKQEPDPAYLPQQQYLYQPSYNQPSFSAAPESTKPPPGEAENIVVKTKFPVARIKRIVQADEDVGKVAQSTPVAVSKALELFMISLALGSADVAKERGSKKVTGAHLKAAVGRDEQFDFLSDIVSKIADTGEKKKAREQSESEREEESDEEYGAKKRKGAKRKRVKKQESEEAD